ncbi:hypothetical protein BH10ACT1_BH10ACT1_29970 [soil metagenome]
MSTPQHQQQSVIEVKTSFFFLAFLLALFKPQASINGGQPFPVGWGTTPVPVPPGQYQVEVWLPYLFFPQMGKNGIIVDAPPGGGVQVWWKSPWLVFLKGAISAGPPSGAPAAAGYGAAPAAQAPWAATPAAAAPVAAGGWHPDPAGRNEQRYYDGTAWTDHVVDAGVQSTDPLGG